ncbi:MAG TPA: hypothetical protein VHR66_24170 [Gemmataceae bacterium]|jgi:hypothetical protein|nr:hypothetical protein [Gemmataceae bacterium]
MRDLPPTRPLSLARGPKLPPWLFSEGAGIQISGDSGSSKSNALEVILERLIRHPGASLLFIDPHGTSARKLRRMILAMGRSVAKRLLYLQPSLIGDGNGKLPTINPLFVPGVPGSWRWQARLTVIVDIVAKILLAAWGEADFNSKPILYKNVTRILTTLAYTGLSLADAKLFLDLQSPVYRPLVRACPDLIARHEMEELPDLRAADRLAQIESAKNRFLGLLSNPIFEAMVSRANGALNFQTLYDDRAIVLINLEMGGVRRPMDQEILANLFLTLAVFTILNTPAEKRYPYFLAADELGVFASSFELIEWLSTQTRKFLARLVVCHQGANRFPDRYDDRLLHAITSQCRTHLHFRHGSGADCDFFGRILALPEYDPHKIKHVQRTPMQFQAGHRLVVLTDESEGTTESSGTTDGTGTTNTVADSVIDTVNFGDTRQLRDCVELARTDSQGSAHARGTSQSTAAQRTSSQSHSIGTSRSRTYKQSLVPIIETRHVVTSVQFFTREEQEAMKASALTKLATGEAFLHVTGAPACPVQFPLAKDPYARTPHYARRREVDHQAMQETSSAFATLDEICDERDALVGALVRHLYDVVGEAEAPAPLLALDAIRGQAPGVAAETLIRRGPADEF